MHVDPDVTFLRIIHTRDVFIVGVVHESLLEVLGIVLAIFPTR